MHSKRTSPLQIPQRRAAAPEQDVTPANGVLLSTDMLEPVVAKKEGRARASGTIASEAKASVATAPAPSLTSAAPDPAAAKAKEAFCAELEGETSASAKSHSPARPPPAPAATEPKPAEASAGGNEEAVSGLPSWARFAALGAVVLAAGLLASTALRTPGPEQTPAVRPSPPPVVVQLQEAEVPGPKAAPVPAPAPVAAPRAAAPAAVPSFVKPAAPAATPSTPAPAASTNWARRFTNWFANGLRNAADRLPETELALEQQVPVVESGVRWALEIRPENAELKAKEALPVFGSAVSKGAEVVARTGLRLGASGLSVASEELPEAGQAVQAATMKALPGIQAGVHFSADTSRVVARSLEQMSKPEVWPSKVPQELRQVVSKSPLVFNAAASVLDTAADIAPSAESFAAYTAGKAVPVFQALLTSASEIASDASNLPVPEIVPLPEAKQVADTFRALGVDPDEVTASVRAKAKDALGNATANLPDPNKVVADALRQMLGEPGGLPTNAAKATQAKASSAAAIAAAVAAPAATVAAPMAGATR